MYMVKFVLKYCVQKELLNLKDSKLTQNFMAIRLVLSDRVTYIAFSFSIIAHGILLAPS